MIGLSREIAFVVREQVAACGRFGIDDTTSHLPGRRNCRIGSGSLRVWYGRFVQQTAKRDAGDSQRGLLLIVRALES